MGDLHLNPLRSFCAGKAGFKSFSCLCHQRGVFMIQRDLRALFSLRPAWNIYPAHRHHDWPQVSVETRTDLAATRNQRGEYWKPSLYLPLTCWRSRKAMYAPHESYLTCVLSPCWKYQCKIVSVISNCAPLFGHQIPMLVSYNMLT